jgi:hypothetical protein
MASEQEIRLALDDLQVPGLERSAGSLNMVRSLTFSGGIVRLELAQLWLNEGTGSVQNSGGQAYQGPARG